MSLSPEEIQGLAEAVGLWRMQEYMVIPFFCFYVYYVITTMDEEFSVILPQRWSRGKILYVAIRYGMLIYVALELCRSYRTYFLISPEGCKALLVINFGFVYLISVTCDFALGLCLGALLQARALYLSAIVALSCALPFVASIINIVSSIQYPAEPVSALDSELGYACYVPSAQQLSDQTIMFSNLDVREYLNFAATILLTVLGLATIAVRYKGHKGRLIQVLRRDGGIHYLSLLAIRLATAILFTRAQVTKSELDANPLYILIKTGNEIIIPILAQRLLINMRKVDFMGSEPVASKLLFAPASPESESDLDTELYSLDVSPESSSRSHPGAGSETPEMREV